MPVHPDQVLDAVYMTHLVTCIVVISCAHGGLSSSTVVIIIIINRKSNYITNYEPSFTVYSDVVFCVLHRYFIQIDTVHEKLI